MKYNSNQQKNPPTPPKNKTGKEKEEIQLRRENGLGIKTLERIQTSSYAQHL